MYDNGVPLITLEIQGMKHIVKQALLDYKSVTDTQVSNALELAMKPENIEGVIRSTVATCVRSAVTEEIQNFFRYSEPGRLAIRQAVQEWMDRVYPVDKE